MCVNFYHSCGIQLSIASPILYSFLDFFTGFDYVLCLNILFCRTVRNGNNSRRPVKQNCFLRGALKLQDLAPQDCIVRDKFAGGEGG